MTLADYLRKNPTFSIAALGIAGAVALFIGVSRMAPSYEANFSLTVDHRELQAPQDYAYDGYYALRASEIFTDTVVSWFKTPAMLDEMRTTASKIFEGNLLEEPAFRVKKFSGQNIVVSVSDSERSRSMALAEAAIEVVTDRSTALNRRADGESLFILKASKPLITEKRFPPARAGLIGLALGLALGFIAVFFATPPKK